MKHEREFFEASGPAWQADISFRHSVPRLVMWRRVNGQREEREPTAKEHEDYTRAEAW